MKKKVKPNVRKIMKKKSRDDFGSMPGKVHKSKRTYKRRDKHRKPIDPYNEPDSDNDRNS